MKIEEDLISLVTELTDDEQNTTAQMASQLMDMEANIQLPDDVNVTTECEMECEERPEPMSDDDILTELNNFIGSSNNSGQSGGDDQDVRIALDYYFGRLPALTKSQIKDTNSSRYVSLDIQDSVEATVAEIMQVFTTGDLVSFTPEGEYDEKQAQMETELLNYMFFDELDGYDILQSALRDCLVNRNATAEVYWDEFKTVTYEEYNQVPQQALPQLLQPKEQREQVEVVEQEEQNGSYSIKLKRTKVIALPKIELIKPENVIVPELYDKHNLDDCDFVARIAIITESDLLARGFDPEIVEKLPEYNKTQDTTYSRQHTGGSFDDYYSSKDNKLVKVYVAYVNLDVDKDGIAERRKIIFGETDILYNEPVSSCGLVNGITTMAMHSYPGISIYDKLKNIQDSKTAVFRSIIDGTRLSSNPRIGVVTGGLNIDDLLTSRTGGVVRMTNPNAVVPLPNPEVPQSSYQFLQLMDSTRSERGGSAVSTASQAMSVAGDSAHGIERVLSAMEQSNALLARTFAESFVRNTFKELHNILRDNVFTPITVKIKGRWVKSVPSEWKQRTKLTITIGGSQNERRARVSALESVINKQSLLAQTGSTLFNEKKLYTALTTQASYADIANADRYFVDPESQEGQQAKQAKDQQDQEAKQKNDEMQQLMAEAQAQLGQAEMMKGQASLSKAQSDFQVKQMQAQISAMEQNQNIRFDYEKLRLDTAVKIAEMETKTDMQMDKQVNDNYKSLMSDIIKTTKEV